MQQWGRRFKSEQKIKMWVVCMNGGVGRGGEWVIMGGWLASGRKVIKVER